MGWLSKWWDMSNPNPSRNQGTAMFFPSLYGDNPQRLQEAQARTWDLQTLLANMGVTGLTGPTAKNAYANLSNIIASEGKTDPLRLNMELSSIDRSNLASQDALRQDAARTGMSNSGLMNALLAARGQAGAAQKQTAIARENAMTEERRRSDLDLFKRLLLDPATDQLALSLGQYNQNRQAASQDSANAASVISSILKAFGGMMGG